MVKESLDGKIAILQLELGAWYSEKEEETSQLSLFKINLKKGILQEVGLELSSEDGAEEVIRYLKRRKITDLYTPDVSSFYKGRKDGFMGLEIEKCDEENDEHWSKYGPICSDDEYGPTFKKNKIHIYAFDEKGNVTYKH